MPHCPSSDFAAFADGKLKLKTVFKLHTLAASKCKSDDDTHNPKMDNATAQKYTATVHPITDNATS